MGNVSNLLMLKNDAACKRRYNVMVFFNNENIITANFLEMS